MLSLSAGVRAQLCVSFFVLRRSSKRGEAKNELFTFFFCALKMSNVDVGLATTEDAFHW